MRPAQDAEALDVFHQPEWAFCPSGLEKQPPPPPSCQQALVNY